MNPVQFALLEKGVNFDNKNKQGLGEKKTVTDVKPEIGVRLVYYTVYSIRL